MNGEDKKKTCHLKNREPLHGESLNLQNKYSPLISAPAKKISPKTNINANNTNSSTQSKITVDQKRTGQGRRIVNTETQGKIHHVLRN